MTDYMSDYPSARESRFMRREILARIAAGETHLRNALPSRDWDHAPHLDKQGKPTGEIVLHASASWSSERSVTMINPTGKRDVAWAQCGSVYPAFVLWFGGCGATYLHVYASSLEDALEQCASWLADHAPGHIMAEWGEEHAALVREACEDAGLVYPPADGADLEGEGYCGAQESAESDLTRTESGFLTSYEWGISLENPSVEELYAFVWAE